MKRSTPQFQTMSILCRGPCFFSCCRAFSDFQFQIGSGHAGRRRRRSWLPLSNKKGCEEVLATARRLSERRVNERVAILKKYTERGNRKPKWLPVSLLAGICLDTIQVPNSITEWGRGLTCEIRSSKFISSPIQTLTLLPAVGTHFQSDSFKTPYSRLQPSFKMPTCPDN